MSTSHPWRSVILGRRKSPYAYLASYRWRRTPSAQALDIITRVTCAQEEIELPLYDMSGADLGFTDRFTYGEFFDRAAPCGFHPCPAETGLALADQYDDQPAYDYRRIGMKPIIDSAGNPRFFFVVRVVDILWLETCLYEPKQGLLPDSRFLLTSVPQVPT